MCLKLRPFAIAVTLLAMALRLQASGTNAEKSEFLLGMLVPPEEPAAASLRDGATLGVELANQSPGPRARLIIRGRTGQWGADGVEAARMVTDDGAQCLIAPPDGATSHLVLQVSGRTAVPVISLSADSSVSRTGVPWMVRIVPRTEEQASALLSGIHASHWIAMIPDGRAGREVARDLREAATNSSRVIEKLIQVNTSLTNAARLCKQVLTNHPGAILLWLDPVTTGRVAKELRAAGFTGVLAGPNYLRTPDFTSTAGDALEGFQVPVPILERDAETEFQHFTNSFQTRFHHEPDATAAEAYDAAMLLIRIFKQSGDRPAHEAFPLTSSHVGASGILAFDAKGNRKLKLQLFTAHDGKFTSTPTAMNR